MIRDPFYREIMDSLGRSLDPESFERCGADLLRSVYPSLVPIRGGDDAGMDGAIADGQGPPMPLVSTTSSDVIGNLTQSLNSYINRGLQRREVVLATSQKLTARRRQNLENKARSLGFTLIQIHDQASIADLLYYSPKWCKELLNLTGDPPALSALPRSSRPVLGHTMIGREQDMVWLRGSSGDLLLYGQPGSGKTFLLRSFAREADGLFVIDEDRDRIARGLRAQHPKFLIVDDAHVRIELLRNLKHMREEICDDFSIVATCWPGELDAVTDTFGVLGERQRELRLLTRDEIVEVISASGIEGPNWIVHELVNQADGRPGLAATLCHLCLVGDIREVLRGNALGRNLLNTFKQLVGQHVKAILAAFSLGGDVGMHLDAVADHLGLARAEVRKVVTGLASGGVLAELSERCLSVRPAALRHVLVRDVFFAGATSLSVDGLLPKVPSRAALADTLIGARACGASICNRLLTDLVEELNSKRLYSHYCALGAEESRWTIKQHPEQLLAVTQEAIEAIPKEIIPLLLTRAVKDERDLHSNPDHPLRLIKDWMTADPSGTGEAMSRRNMVMQCAVNWTEGGGSTDIGLRAMASALDPVFEAIEPTPGSGLGFAIRRGLIVPEEQRSIQGFWPKVLDFFLRKNIENWNPIREIIASWAYPKGAYQNVPEAMYKSMRSFARQMLRDVVAGLGERPGVLPWAKRMAKHLKCRIKITLDPDFEILHPIRSRQNRQREEKKEIRAVKALAERWSTQEPYQVIEQILRFKREASLAKLRDRDWTRFVCNEIASKAKSPELWVKALLAHNAGGELILPFLMQAARANRSCWQVLADSCLDIPSARWAAVHTILTAPSVPAPLLRKAIASWEGLRETVETACCWHGIPEDRMLCLLRHEDRQVAMGAAAGEWQCEPTGKIRESLRADWRAAVVEAGEKDYVLREMFASDSSLAFDWLSALLARGPSVSWRHNDTVPAAINAMDKSQRGELLATLPATWAHSDMAKRLIGNDTDLYQSLLNNPDLADFHLIPLRGRPVDEWIEKAELALDAGYAPEKIVATAYGEGYTWAGRESAMWAEWRDAFSKLLAHDDARVRQVAQIGKEIADERFRRALEKEQEEAIHGQR